MNDDLKAQFDLLRSANENKRVKEEKEFLAQPFSQNLPDIFNGKRSSPNCFLRSALFGMVKNGTKRQMQENIKIFSSSQYEIYFTGYELDQKDLEIWDLLIYLAKEYKIDDTLRITLYELCKRLNLEDSNSNRNAVIKRVERLKIGTIKITQGKQFIFGSLINNGSIDKMGDGKFVIEYNKRLAYLFINNDFTFIDMRYREMLGNNQLAKWLYQFYATHKNPIPMDISHLQNMCHSKSSPKEFKRMLKESLELIKNVYININSQSKWDYLISVNTLHIYPFGTKKQLTLL